MNRTKIQLSASEMDLVSNAEWLLTKNRVIEKVYHLFGILADRMQENLQKGKYSLPVEAMLLSPKISRGENYRGLPYVMLDFPRCFSKEDVFAIRIMFWWGHYFLVTLHLKGRYRELFLGPLKKNRDRLARYDFELATGEDEWQHEPAPGYSISLRQSGNPLDEKKDFLKLISKFPFSLWEQGPEKLGERWEVLLDAMELSSPGGETGL